MMFVNMTRFPAPGLGEDARQLYETLYGEAGARFLEVLDTSPQEIAVLSRMAAYLQGQRGGEKHGCAEDGKGDWSL